MMIGMMLRLTKVIRSKIKWSPAFKKLNGLHLGLGLFAVALFALAYAAETKAIITLESSQGLFEVVPNRLQGVYR
jgi:hypothetical protein